MSNRAEPEGVGVGTYGGRPRGLPGVTTAKKMPRRSKKNTIGGPRVLSQKHLQLVVFCYERPVDETWAVRMKAWNEEHPEWGYHEVKNSIRDANQGLRRLLRPNARFERSTEDRE